LGIGLLQSNGIYKGFYNSKKDEIKHQFLLYEIRGQSIHFMDLPVRIDPEADDLCLRIVVFDKCNRFAKLLLLCGVITCEQAAMQLLPCWPTEISTRARMDCNVALSSHPAK
jgi:hypothetical protein